MKIAGSGVLFHPSWCRPGGMRLTWNFKTMFGSSQFFQMNPQKAYDPFVFYGRMDQLGSIHGYGGIFVKKSALGTNGRRHKGFWKRGLGAAAVAVVLVPATASVAFADTTSSDDWSDANLSTTSSFQTSYQNNASQESKLLAQANSNTFTSTNITNIRNTVQQLNSEVSTLYGEEQTLASVQTQLPNPQDTWQSTLTQLQQQRQELLHEAIVAWFNVNVFAHHDHDHGHGHGPKLKPEPLGLDLPGSEDQARQDWKTIYKNLLTVDDQIRATQRDHQQTEKKSFNDGLTSLQKSILSLQETAINYTQVWISLEQQGSSTGSTGSTGSTTSSGLTTPTGLSSTGVSNTGWTTQWNAVSGATGYDVYLNGTLVASDVSGTSYTFTGENNNTTYTVGIQAVNPGLNEGSTVATTQVQTSTTPILPAPQVTAVTGITGSSFSVTWNSVSDARGYDVYINGQRVLTNYQGTSYAFTGESANTTYTVDVTAVDSNGQQSAQSYDVKVTTLH